jgi:two-component system LytT family response regulator
MIRTVIVDDEEQARQALKKLLDEFFPEVVVLGEAENAKDAFALFKELKPDLVFLDVMLQNVTGFDILEQYREYSFSVIFVTAHSEYAFESIRTNAIDYLLKPLRIRDLRIALERVKEKMFSQQEFDSHIIVRSTSFDQHSNITIIPDSTGFSVIRMDEIIRCEASRNYSVIYLESGKQVVAVRGISDLEQAWEGFGFVRVHKSHLVNLYSIRKYIRGRGGELEMMDGSIIPVARERKDSVLEKFMR